MATTKSVKIHENIYATPTGLKVGSRGVVQEPGDVLGQCDKGKARKIRKSLRAAGFNRHAAAKRTQ